MSELNDKDRVYSLSKNASSLDDLEEMLARLVRGLNEGKFPMAEDHDVASYLEAVYGWVRDSHGYQTNTDTSFDPEMPTWNVLAKFLQAAIHYN